MEISQATSFLATAGPFEGDSWADLGAGTGTFTLALNALLPPGATIHAVDKHPIGLYRLEWPGPSQLSILDGDFMRELALPPLDGMLMANALHYAPDPVACLKNVLQALKPGGKLILVEYDLEEARGPWVPFPVSLKRFQQLAPSLNLHLPQETHRLSSAYGNQFLYCAVTTKKENI
jgi:ubiquinone/menaquinone biosynthesis C-methylase UbiE